MKKNKILVIVLILTFLLFAFVLWGILGSLLPRTVNYEVRSSTLPEAFDGFRIAHISDLHNAQFGEENQDLLHMLRSIEPDIIVVTGDLIDSYSPNVDISAGFMEKAVQIAPCYYVFGNHELRMPVEYASLKTRMIQAGVTILEDAQMTLQIDDQAIQIAGLKDYSSLSAQYVSHITQGDDYTILLTHRPEHFSVYAETKADLVLAGHAHGGQVRLPLIGALFAPGQGLFPKYADSLHVSGATTMIISRGLGNSSLPFRFYCPPELVIVELFAE